MLATQPPIKIAKTSFFVDHIQHGFYRDGDISNPNGVMAWDMIEGSLKTGERKWAMDWDGHLVVIEGMILATEAEICMTDEELREMEAKARWPN